MTILENHGDWEKNDSGAALASAAELLLWIGTIAQTGPLAPNGWLTYALYPLFLCWLLPTAIVMLRSPRSKVP